MECKPTRYRNCIISPIDMNEALKGNIGEYDPAGAGKALKSLLDKLDGMPLLPSNGIRHPSETWEELSKRIDEATKR